jgi:hypothetical protein
MREGGTKRGRAELTFFDSPRLNFGTAATERMDAASAVGDREEGAAAARSAEKAWKDAQRARRAAGRGGRGIRALSADAQGAGDEADDARAGGEEAAASQVEDHAAAFGRLVHALLALPGPLMGDALHQAGRAQRLAYGLSGTEAAEAADLAERAQALPAVAAARSAEVVYRELPFTCWINGQLTSGRIDLAYRCDGAWTLIDFKTARLADSAEAATSYREQIERYRTALSTLTGESVAAALCLVRTGELVSV